MSSIENRRPAVGNKSFTKTTIYDFYSLPLMVQSRVWRVNGYNTPQNIRTWASNVENKGNEELSCRENFSPMPLHANSVFGSQQLFSYSSPCPVLPTVRKICSETGQEMLKHYNLDLGLEVDLEDQGHHLVIFQEEEACKNWNVHRIVIISCKSSASIAEKPGNISRGAKSILSNTTLAESSKTAEFSSPSSTTTFWDTLQDRLAKHSMETTATRDFISRYRRNKLDNCALALPIDMSNLQYYVSAGAELTELVIFDVNSEATNGILQMEKTIVRFDHVTHPFGVDAGSTVKELVKEHHESIAATTNYFGIPVDGGRRTVGGPEIEFVRSVVVEDV